MRMNEIREAIEAGIRDPVAWEVALAGLARRARAVAAGLSVWDVGAGVLDTLATVGMDPGLMPFLKRHAPRSQLVQLVVRTGQAQAATRALGRRRLEASPVYQGWLVPQRFHDVMLVPVVRQGPRCVTVCAMSPPGRVFGAAQIDAVKRFRADLARAVEFRRRIAGERLLREVLFLLGEQRGEALFLLDPDLRIRDLNTPARKLMEAGRGVGREHDGRLRLPGTTGSELARRIGEALLAGGSVHHTLVVNRGEDRPLLLELAIAPGGPDLIAGAPGIVLRVWAPELVGPPDPELLQRLFDLSAGEARAVAAVLASERLEQAAERVGLEVATIKSHLTRVFARLGVHQAGLRNLLSAYGVRLPVTRPPGR